MGEIIRANAARADIVFDARRTLDAARLRGDAWMAPAEARLVEPLELYAAADAQRAGLDATVRALRAAVQKADDDADDAVVREVERLFDLGGRRARDPFLALLAPGGASAYVEGPPAQQPLRMALFARLLRQIGHRHIPKAETDAAADRIDAAAAPLAAALEAVGPPAAELQLLDSVLRALARDIRAQLASLKRSWAAEGFSDADIHAVIPNRPSASAAREPAGPAA